MKVVDLTDIETQKILSSEGRCSKHNTVLAEYLCENCKEVMCISCKVNHMKTVSSHKVCNFKEEGVMFGEEINEEAEKDKEIIDGD